MSDVTTDTMMHSVAAGITVDIAEEGFDRVSALLAGIPGGANRAVGSALARAAAAGKTVAKRAVTQEYAISSSEFSNRTKNINNIQRGSNGEVSINFGYRGQSRRQRLQPRPQHIQEQRQRRRFNFHNDLVLKLIIKFIYQ